MGLFREHFDIGGNQMKATQTATRDSSRKRLLVMLVLAALLLAVTLLRYCSNIGVPFVVPMVVLERSGLDDSSTPRTATVPSSLPDGGEVYRTADRLRDASALALAAALYAASEEARHRSIRSVDTLIAGVRSAGLFPPGITGDSAAMLQSDRSKLLLRFRPEPLAIEVLSLSRFRDDGPAVMIRIPSLDPGGNRGSVLIADRLGDINPPAPFAGLTDCFREGWLDQTFNQAEIPEAEQQQLRVWLNTRRPQQ
jgi:hypothetical protein